MIKKLLIFGVAAVLSLASIGAAAAEQTTFRQFDLPIKVLYNARQIASDVQPEAKNGVVFVPFRAVADALGAQLDVTPDWKTITFIKGDRKVAITLESCEWAKDGASGRVVCDERDGRWVSQGGNLIGPRILILSPECRFSEIWRDNDEEISVIESCSCAVNGISWICCGRKGKWPVVPGCAGATLGERGHRKRRCQRIYHRVP